jgi:hypothetical protein
MAPNLFAGILVERNNLGGFNVGVDDDEILEQNGRRTGAPFVDLRADARVPELLAVEVEGVNASSAEESEHAFSV